MNNRIRKMRIPVELQQLQKTSKDHGITCTSNPPNNDDYSQLLAVIPGPKGSPYELGTFKIGISIGEQYPFRPPTFKFLTPVYHPNIDNSGNICLDLLRMPPNGSYNPAITLESILLSIQLLLATPNPEDPLRGDAADLYKANKDLFNEKARAEVRKLCLAEGPTATNGTDESHQAVEVDKSQGTADEVAKKRLKLRTSH